MNRIPKPDVVALPQSASTNDDGFVYLSERDCGLLWTLDQTRGRGSRGRGWSSPAGYGLAMTLAIKGTWCPSPLSMCYPLFAGVLLWDTLKPLLPSADLKLKWPNDVMLKEQKLAGILCESRWAGRQAKIVIGMGLNLKRHPFWQGLPRPAAALDEFTHYSVNELVQELADRFPTTMAAYTIPSVLHQAWLSRSNLRLGSRLLAQAEGRRWQGRFVGLDKDGALLIETANEGLTAIRQTCEDFALLADDGLVT